MFQRELLASKIFFWERPKRKPAPPLPAEIKVDMMPLPEGEFVPSRKPTPILSPKPLYPILPMCCVLDDESEGGGPAYVTEQVGGYMEWGVDEDGKECCHSHVYELRRKP